MLAGVEFVHMIREGQFAIDGADACRLSTNFFHWQEWSVQFDGRNAISGIFCLLIVNATKPSTSPNFVPADVLARPSPLRSTEP